MKNTKSYRALTALLAAAGMAAAAGGCADTEIQGVILDEDLNREDVFVPLGRGVDEELGDNWTNCRMTWILGSAPDAIANQGTAASEYIYDFGDYSNRPGSCFWENFHEAAWGGYKQSQRLEAFYEGKDEDLTTFPLYERNPIAARFLLVSGIAERLLGEIFCEVVYNYGPDGGFLIDGPNDSYDRGNVVPRDSAFVRSVAALQRSLEIAQNALDANVSPPDQDPMWEPETLVHGAHGALAQAYMSLEEWDLAAQHASEVPTEFILWRFQHDDVEDSDEQFWWHDDTGPDITLWNTPIGRQWPDDPRAHMRVCGEWEDPESDGDTIKVWWDSNQQNANPPTPDPLNDMGLEVIQVNDCAPSGGEWFTERDYPWYKSLKYPDSDGADVELVTGTEMRLIQAEAALIEGDFDEFKTQIDLARVEGYGMDPIPETVAELEAMGAGELEFPNAEDDGWSILDRERLLTTFYENDRRYWDMERWDHPFAENNIVLHPEVLPLAIETAPRETCFPLPSSECGQNPELVDGEHCQNLNIF